MGDIRIVKAKDSTGANAFYILEVLADKLDEYDKDIANGKMMPLDYYGIILDSAYGEEMPLSIKVRYESLIKS